MINAIKEKLIKYLPNYYQKSEITKKYYEVISEEIVNLNALCEDVRSQLHIETATWGLVIWERVFGLTTDTTDTYENRRGRVIVRMNGFETTTVNHLKTMCELFVERADIIEHNNEYRIEVVLNDSKGFKNSLDALYETIEEIKPAHLGLDYTLATTVKQDIYIGSATLVGETTTIYPYVQEGLNSTIKVEIKSAQTTGAETSIIYPKPKTRRNADGK